jgi:hypothetical protein
MGTITHQVIFTLPSFIVHPQYNRCISRGVGVIWHSRVILVAIILSDDYLFMLYRLHRLQNLALVVKVTDNTGFII